MLTEQKNVAVDILRRISISTNYILLYTDSDREKRLNLRLITIINKYIQIFMCDVSKLAFCSRHRRSRKMMPVAENKKEDV